MALTHELKDYMVYRADRTGELFQCHMGVWLEWAKVDLTRNLTVLVNNVTQNEARQFCQLTKEQ